MEKDSNKKRFKISVWQYLALGYLIVIFIGSILLILPFATKDGRHTDYFGALFTSASATCITGLSPYVLSEHWTLFGQIVILILVQLGGLGFMTFVSTVFVFIKKFTLYERTAMMQASGGKNLSGTLTMIKRIFIGTGIFEFTGAVLLSIRFIGQFGAKGIYYAIFHSITAFCNAGFDVMGASSLSAYATDPLVSLTICALIILGGLGFCVWGDIFDCRFNFKKFQLNTKVVLLMTAILIVLPTAMLLGVEWKNEALASYNFGEKLLVSLFNAIAPRTAGFYVLHPAELSDSGYVITVLLMFIGGSSGSTAGGIKVGTFAVIVMGMLGVFRGNRDVNIGKKRIEYSLVLQALAIFTACLTLVTLATLAMCIFDPKFLVESIVFECVSALSTAGLSMGITSSLNVASKIILIILMYAGRVGILTLALAIGEKKTQTEIRKPVDVMLIG